MLFSAEYIEPFTHPKVIEANLALLEKSQLKSKKGKGRRRKKAEPLRDQFEPLAVALPATGRDKLHTLDSTIITKPETMISLSCFSRPSNFSQKLQDQTKPIPSNDIKRKTIE